MTNINVDTNIDQAFIDSNTGPFFVQDVTITLTDDLVLNISSTKFFIADKSCTVIGGGYKVTLENGTEGFLQTTISNGIIDIRNLGVISGSGHSLDNNRGGILYNPSSIINTKIKNCYYIGNVTNLNSGGIYSDLQTNNTAYIQNCYVIGDVTGTNAGGIVGSRIANSSKSLITNCYFIGNVSGTNAGAITGAEPGYNNGQVYVYNCYHSSGNTFGLEAGDDSYVGNKNTYDYNGSWLDSNATSAGLSTSPLSTSDMTSSSGWTQYGTGSGSFNLTSTDLSNAGISNGESTMFSFSANTPYGITSYTVSPYIASKYTSATSQAANCFCAGTKITLKDGNKVNIELVQQGDEVMTPHGVIKKVLHVGKMWFNGNSQKHYPYLIPKDYFEEGKPCEDTYVSGAHSLLFSKAQGELLGLPDGRTKERGNGLDLFLIKSFAQKTEYQKVCVLKGYKCPYGFNYYHLVVEDNYGFIANNLPSESLELKDFKANFEEINKNINEEIN